MSETKRRGRPIGSKNKPKIELKKGNGGSYVLTINLEKQIEEQPINRDSHMGYIKWGTRNDYGIKLSNLYYNSPTHKACCDFAATSVLGDGVDYVATNINQFDNAPNYQYSWDELIYNIALDKVIYGGYALQIIKNNDDKTYSFYHQPMSNVRASQKDEDGVITSYWISEDWTALSKYPPIEIPAFGFQEDEEIKKGQAYLFVSWDYAPDIEYYGCPMYTSAIKAIQAEAELLRYDLHSIMNNFCATGILTLNRIDDEDEKKAIIDNIQSMFVNPESANSIIINFKSNDEETPATFTKIDKDAGNNVNLFEQLNSRVIAKIIASHRISNKALIGYEADSAMLGGEGNVLNVAYNLYNKTVITKLRNSIVRTINNALKLNGIDTEIVLKPLTFNIETSASTQNTNSNVSEENTNEQSEKATSENNNNTIIER